VKTIVVDVQKPAQLTLPSHIKNIAIVDNAVPQPKLWGHIDYKYTKKGERLYEEASAPADSICDIFTETLYEGLLNTNMFDNVSLFEYPVREDLSFSEERPLDSLRVRELAEISSSDAIFSLDRFLVSTIARDEPYDFENTEKFLDLKLEARFRLYSKEGNMISSPFYFSDSLYWSAVFTKRGDRLLTQDSLPSREEAIKQAAVYTAEKITGAFTPKWVNEARVYYGENKEANKLVDANNWTDAIKIWQNAFEIEEKNKKKARLASNIALGYELSDNIKEALQWAQTAVDLYDGTAENSIDNAYFLAAKFYQDNLLERYKDFRILDLRKDEE